MSSIDERIVSMKFNNAQFQQGVASTLSSLDKLKAGLSFGGASKGLENLSAASKNVDLSSIGASIDGIQAKFSALSVVGIAALGTLASKAATAGAQMVKSLSVDQVTDGFADYELKVKATQTIMAGTGEDIGTTSKYLKELDLYADKTVYNLSDMVNNIGKFTNAGVKLPVATKAMIGISNAAALSGATAEEASRAMYNLGQAIGQGSVKLIDWKSVELANMGTVEFKQQLMDSALAMGTLTKSSDGTLKTLKGTTVTTKNFSTTLNDAWLTSEALTKTLENYGSTSTAIGKKSWKAAQDVKSFSMMMETLKASASTGWTDSFELIIGNLPEATKLFTNMTNTIGGMVGKSADARNQILQQWAKKGGRVALIDGFANAFKALGSVIKPIREAFRTIFPAVTGEQLANLSKTFRDFFKGLILGKENMDRLKRTFVGVFSIFKIGWEIVKGITRYFFSLFSIVGSGAGGILSLTAVVGDFITNVLKWINLSGGISGFFDRLIQAKANILQPMVDFVSAIVQAFAELFSGDVSGFTDRLKGAFAGLGDLFNGYRTNFLNMLGTVGKVLSTIGIYLSGLGSKALAPVGKLFTFLSEKLQGVRDLLAGLVPKVDLSGILNATTILSGFKVVGEQIRAVWDRVANLFSSAGSSGISGAITVGETAKRVWEGVVSALSNVGGSLGPILGRIGEFFSVISDKIIGYIKGMSFEEGVALLNTGFFIAMYMMLRKFLKSMSGVMQSASGMLDNLGGIFQQLTNSLKTMQQNVRANIILKIGIAIGILTASVYVLSRIPVKDLKKAMIALSVMFVELGAILVAFSFINKGKTSLSKTSFGLILLAIAIDILASAVKKISALDWESLAKGLTGVGGLLVALTLFSKFASADSAGLSSGAGLVLLAVAIKLLVDSVSTLGTMDTGTLIQGIASLGIMLVLLGGIVRAFNKTKGIVQAAVGLLILTVALKALVDVIYLYNSIDFGVMTKGLLMMTATLALIGKAMRSFPKSMPSTAAGLLVVSGALVIIARVLQTLGAMDNGSILQSLFTLDSALTIIAHALSKMEVTGRGALALIGVSAALLVLAGVLKILGDMDNGSILQGLGAIAGIFTILAVASLAGPGIAVLAQGILVLGAAMILAGAGFMLFAGALAMLAATGAVGFMVLLTGIRGLLPMIPLLAQQFALGMIAVAKVIGDAGPTLLVALTKVLMSLLKAFGIIAPEAVKKFVGIIGELIKGIIPLIPKVVELGFTIIKSFLKGIADNIKDVIVMVGDIIGGFVDGLTVAIPTIVAAGVNFIVALIQGIVSALPKLATAVVSLVMAFLSVITANLPQLMGAGAKLLVAFITGIANALPSIIAAAAKLIVAFVTGIANALPSIIAAVAKLIVAFLTGIANALPSIIAAAARVIVAFVTGIANALPSIIAAAAKLIVAFITGIGNALPKIVAAVGTLIAKFLFALAGQVPKIVAGGVSIIAALIQGVADSAVTLVNAAADAVITFITGISTAIDDHAQELGTAGGKLAVSLVKGLTGGLGAAIREVAKSAGPIGGAILNKIADVLGAKSPSTEAFKFGISVNQGLANGLNKYSGLAASQAGLVGAGAIDAMRKSISGMSDLVATNIDSQPTIRPVLDLTGVQKDAGILGSLLPNPQISVGATYSKAASASAGYTANQLRSTLPVKEPVASKEPVAPRPVEFHIGTIQDGDSLLRRARANDRMLSLAEGGDSPQVIGVGI